MKANSEFEIESFIWDKMVGQSDDLKKRGFPLWGNFFCRQLKLPGCGIPDIVGFEKIMGIDSYSMNVYIYELKKGVVDGCDFVQLIKYISFFESNRIGISKLYDIDDINIFGVLMGHSFERPTLSFSSLPIESEIHFYEYDIGINDGIVFRRASGDYFCQSIESFMPEPFEIWLSKDTAIIADSTPSHSSDTSNL